VAQPVRFVHASDLHLDATLSGVDATDDRVIGALVRATFDALDRVVEICVEREADFLVIAGDLYNSADRSLGAELAFQKRMQRLAEAGIRAFVVHGNHDPADGWSAGLDLPDSVVVFSDRVVERCEVVKDGELACAVYGRSFPSRQVQENYARQFRRQTGDPLAVAVLHANVGQREGWDDYAPCSVQDLRAAGMDYWALGHIHVPGRISDNPVAVYSGSTQASWWRWTAAVSGRSSSKRQRCCGGSSRSTHRASGRSSRSGRSLQIAAPACGAKAQSARSWSGSI
jgi:DNA repair exonuclease SbcCD nuclease subunit